MALAKGLSAIESAAESAVKDIVEAHGLTLWDVVFVKEGAGRYLRFFIDKPGGVSIEDCEAVDTPINETIDRQSFIDMVDYLEVCSAGLERPVRRLSQVEQSVGKKIKLKTYKQREGLPAKTVCCVLESFDGEKVKVSGDFGSAEIPVQEISCMNYDDFDDFNELMEELPENG